MYNRNSQHTVVWQVYLAFCQKVRESIQTNLTENTGFMTLNIHTLINTYINILYIILKHILVFVLKIQNTVWTGLSVLW